MASIVSKKLGPAGSTGHVTLHGAGTGADFNFTYDVTGEALKFVPLTISKVINMTSADVTYAGLTFAPGIWDLFESPVAATSATTTLAGNVIVKLHGRIEVP